MRGRGPLARLVAVADGVAATVRRRQREREPRVVVYDGSGHARTIEVGAAGYDGLLVTAERMVAEVDEAAPAKATGSRGEPS